MRQSDKVVKDFTYNESHMIILARKGQGDMNM